MFDDGEDENRPLGPNNIISQYMDKIQELTSKLYAEGVERGNEEAKKIVAGARAQEKGILEEARNLKDIPKRNSSSTPLDHPKH